MEIASSATGTWQDLVLLSVGSACTYRWEGLSREVLGLEASVLGGVGIDHCVIVVAGRSFLSGFFEKLANYHAVGLESF